MFDLGWTELLLIGIVALIVVGPKDLPVMFRTLGRYTARLRAMARDFTRAMEEAADESGVRDVASDFYKAADPKSLGLDTLKNAVDFDEIDPFNEKSEKSGSRATSGTDHAPSGPDVDETVARSARESRKIHESPAARATAALDAEAAARNEADTPSATDTPKA